MEAGKLEKAQQYLDVAGWLTSEIDSKKAATSFVNELEVKTDRDIQIKENSELDTAAKSEYAEVHFKESR